ncbi:MAG: hypothetical protein J5649_09020 [Lachnospiraceae bacterium]|nr:hypothetical protein [Lachnospiraceae bacterium]
MSFRTILIKSLFLLAVALVLLLPFLLEGLSYWWDKRKKRTYKRFRIVVFTFIYIILITILLSVVKDLIAGVSDLSAVRWIAQKVSLSDRFIFCVSVSAAVIINGVIGLLFRWLASPVRAGTRKLNLVVPKKKDGTFSLFQRIERRVIRYFYSETWFFVGKIIKYLCFILTALYVTLFVLYEIPTVFHADWLPYESLTKLFRIGYRYPTITLLALWEAYFFLRGIELVEYECPELLNDEVELKDTTVDLAEIDREVRNQFKGFFACEVNLEDSVHEEIASTHSALTKCIAEAVEKDPRNPQVCRDVYLKCTDKLTETDDSVLINGSFFSEFSAYFLRYLSVVVARGDNVVFVCNSDAQVDEVYRYLQESFSQQASIYYEGTPHFEINFDNPIWKIAKSKGEQTSVENAVIDDCSIFVTSLGYLCTTDFESLHSRFLQLLSVVVLVDSLNTVNMFNRQLTMFNTKLTHITKRNALLSKDSMVNAGFRVRYMSKQVRYVCFDDTRTPGLDKVLKNLLDVPFEAADTMITNKTTMVRCYRYEGALDSQGRRSYPQFIDTKEEEVGVLMNMAVLCLAKGASTVTVFAEDLIPYANIDETIQANRGKVSISADGSNIRLNAPFCNPDNYSVIIAMDSGDNLPATIRRYAAMVSDTPSLIMVFSRPYLMRDYYIRNVNSLWSSSQIERIPVEIGTSKDIAQRIMVKANSGGVSEREILSLASGDAQFASYAGTGNVSAILREVLHVYAPEKNAELFRTFEYSSSQDFDENGDYCSENRVKLRKRGEIYDMINGRDMAVMSLAGSEIILPLPRRRITQNYIAGQNLLYNGNIYHIDKIDISQGRLYVRLAVGGKNNEVYRYVQAREYHVELNREITRDTKHIELHRRDNDVCIDDVYVSVFRAPMEVLTKGYYEIDPHTLALNVGDSGRRSVYVSISDPGNDALAKQAYRKYGNTTSPTDFFLQSGNVNAYANDARMMSIRIKGQFGKNLDKTMLLAAVMLNEIIHSMFPSVADSVVVCPVLHGEFTDDEAKSILRTQPQLVLRKDPEGAGDDELISEQDFTLVIIEDCETDLGVVSVLATGGDDVLNTLFNPVFEYLNWYTGALGDSNYLKFGYANEVSCFDIDSLFKLSKILGDDKHDLKFTDVEAVMVTETCDFCGKRYAKSEHLHVLEDGRRMCRACELKLVGNDRRALKTALEHAKIFLESTYGVATDELDYEFCFAASKKIDNTLKNDKTVSKRGQDIPLKSYILDRKVYVENSIPAANLSELLVRELTHVWQIKKLPLLDEAFAEGQIALVSLQYLRFLHQSSLASARTTYYESTEGIAGIGYRALVSELLANPQYNNNPFRYLREKNGEEIGTRIPRVIAPNEFGRPYIPKRMDRVAPDKVPYFYYNRLNSSMQTMYNQFVEGIRNFSETITVSGTSEEIDKVSDAVKYDHPELFWYKTCSWIGSTVTLKYGATKEETESLQRQIYSSVSQYLHDIEPSMSAYDVALRLQAKIIAAVDYDTIALNKEDEKGGPDKDKIDFLRTICGVFINGKAVCAGYARALQYLLQRCGVECAEVVGNIRKESNNGKSETHAWNIVKIDGDYYYLDATWDDSSDTVQTVKSTDLGFDYFCVTTEEIRRTRDIDLCPVPMPVCAAVRANYFTHNDYVLDEYNLGMIKTMARTAASEQRKSFAFKCSTKDLYLTAMDRLFNTGNDGYEVVAAAASMNRKIKSNAYTYTCDKNIRTITIKFKNA